MSGRNIKLPAVVNPESQFISSACYQDIFWNIFHINNLGVALTDIDGKMLLSNQDFITKVLEGSSPIDLSHYVGDLGTFHVLTPELREITVQSQNYVIKLCRMTLRESAAGAAYLWLASPEIDLRKNHQIITLKNLYRSFINSTFEFIFRTSTTDKLLFSNKHFIKSLGFENYRVAKTISVSELFQDAVVYTTLKQRIFTEKKITNETVHFKTRDGRRLVGLVNCQLHNDEKGKPVFNWTVLDISQRFEHEEDLKQKNEQLAKVNAQMEKFLYSTSHDLRSPLTSILGLVNLMRMELKDDNILEYVSKIEMSALKLDKIIKDINSFSKTTYQRVKNDKIEFEQLIWKVINNYQNDQHFKRIDFEVKMTSKFAFYSDRDRIETIIDGIIRNAIHFMDVNKTRPFVRVDVKVDHQEVRVEVIDNGVGIAKQHHDKIFNMFYKASLNSRGAGLGLYIVKEGLEQLHGSVEVDSEVGFGSVFRLQIPNGQQIKSVWA